MFFLGKKAKVSNWSARLAVDLLVCLLPSVHPSVTKIFQGKVRLAALTSTFSSSNSSQSAWHRINLRFSICDIKLLQLAKSVSLLYPVSVYYFFKSPQNVQNWCISLSYHLIGQRRKHVSVRPLQKNSTMSIAGRLNFQLFSFDILPIWLVEG